MKNKTIILIFSLIIGFSTLIKAQKQSGYLVRCQFKGLPDKTKVYLTTQEGDTIVKQISFGDKFSFKGRLDQEGRFLFIHFDTLITKVTSKAIFVCNKPIVVYGSIGNREVEILGSPEQELYIQSKGLGKTFAEQMDKAQTEANLMIQKIASNSNLTEAQRKLEIKVVGEQIKTVIDSLKNDFSALLKKWLMENKQSLFAPYILELMHGQMKTADVNEVFEGFPNRTQESYYGQQFKKEWASANLAKKVKQGELLPEFRITAADQKVTSVLEYVKKAKITLLDFWASWCHPCRAETPNMKKVYDAFHEKGFNIIGISSDAKEADWKKALTEDNTPWFHGRDNVDKIADIIFSIKSIPAFALVDGNGKLIAFSCGMSNVPSFGPEIRGEGLYKTIEILLNQKGK